MEDRTVVFLFFFSCSAIEKRSGLRAAHICIGWNTCCLIAVIKAGMEWCWSLFHKRKGSLLAEASAQNYISYFRVPPHLFNTPRLQKLPHFGNCKVKNIFFKGIKSTGAKWQAIRKKVIFVPREWCALVWQIANCAERENAFICQ